MRSRPLNVFHRDSGPKDAPTLLLLHGFPSSRIFETLIPRLADRHHVVAPDYPGFGLSASPAPSRYGYTFDGIAGTVDHLTTAPVLTSYGLHLQDHGGPVGLRLAHPDRVQAIVIQNAAAGEYGLGPGSGHDVTATVVDVSGALHVVLRGDHATIHTRDRSFRKARAIVTMGPIFHLEATTAFGDLVPKHPGLARQVLAATPNVTALSGGAVSKAGDETVGAFGIAARLAATKTRRAPKQALPRSPAACGIERDAAARAARGPGGVRRRSSGSIQARKRRWPRRSQLDA